MLNETRSIFPSYSGLNEVRVQWPTPPRRSAMARNLNDLWNIHISEPHVTHDLGPGAGAPLPDEDGYDPNTLSEDSSQNVLANRGSVRITLETRNEIHTLLQDVFSKQLEMVRASKKESLFDLKKRVRKECPGTFLVYNGSSTPKLLEAFALCRALEKGAVDWVGSQAYSINAKEEFIEYIKPSAEARHVLLVPDQTIIQQIMNNTVSVDNLENTLRVLGLSSENSYLLENDDQFRDFRLNAAQLKLKKNLTDRSRLLDGDLSVCFQSFMGQLPSVVTSADCKAAVLGALYRCIGILKTRQLKDAHSLKQIMETLEKDFEEIGVDPALLPQFQQEKAFLQQVQTAAEETVDFPHDMEPQSAIRNPRDIKASAENLGDVAARISPRNAGVVAEICMILCGKDVLTAKANGIEATNECSIRLADALEKITQDSPNTRSHHLQQALEKTQANLRREQKRVSLENLNSSVLTDQRKALLSQYIGA